MANALYDAAREGFLTATINMSTQTIKAALVTEAYAPDAPTLATNLATHNMYDDISAYVVGTDQTLASKTVTGGVFDAGDCTFTTVAAGSTVKYVVIYRDTTVPGTSPLIACIDTGTGIPLATNGGDVVITWDSGANKIFKL